MKYFWLIIFLIPAFAFGQKKEDYDQIRYTGLGFENDLFQLKNQSDKFFSAGFFYELGHPLFDHKVSRFVLLGLKKAPVNEFGIRINHLGLTPSDISLPAIDTLDRPYAGLLYANFYRVSSNYLRGFRLESTLRLGIMGPAAGMEGVQKSIHRATGSTPPIGWDSQIGNSLMLDYHMKITKKIPIHVPFFETRMTAEAEIGSVWNFVGAGLEFQLGYYNNWLVNRFGISNKRQVSLEQGENTNKSFALGNIDRKFQFYIFFHPTLIYSFYDGTTSGGLIALENNPHTLSNSDTENLLLIMDTGAVIQYKFFGFRYRRVIRSGRFQLNDDAFSYGQFDVVVVF